MKEGQWAQVRAGACPPGELWVQEAELQALGQLSVGEAEADEGTAFSQRGLQLQSTQGTKWGGVRPGELSQHREGMGGP